MVIYKYGGIPCGYIQVWWDSLWLHTSVVGFLVVIYKHDGIPCGYIQVGWDSQWLYTSVVGFPVVIYHFGGILFIHGSLLYLS